MAESIGSVRPPTDFGHFPARGHAIPAGEPMLLVFNNHRPNHDIPDLLAKRDLVDVVQPFAVTAAGGRSAGDDFIAFVGGKESPFKLLVSGLFAPLYVWILALVSVPASRADAGWKAASRNCANSLPALPPAEPLVSQVPRCVFPAQHSEPATLE